MRAIVQRVKWAEVEADGEVAARIEQGLLAYVGVAVGDTEAEAEQLQTRRPNSPAPVPSLEESG